MSPLTRFALYALILTALAASTGCKRKVHITTVTRPAESPSLSTQSGSTPTPPSIDDLEPIAPLGKGIGFKTPDGEGWTRYPSGLMIHDLRPGEERRIPKLGQTLSVAYSGMFPENNRVFDSKPKSDPLSFRLGTRNIIKGWNLAISTMALGGLRRVYIPADLAYGPAGKLPIIPPNQPLIFEIELLDFSGDAIFLPPAGSTATQPEPLGPPVPATNR